jgi:hypothetical protein
MFMHIEVALPLSRRELLILFLALAFVNVSQRPHIQFPIEPRARLAVTSWPFRAYIKSPTNRGRKTSVARKDLKEFPGFVVEKFRVHNVNPFADHFSSTDDTYLAAFRRGRR